MSRDEGFAIADVSTAKHTDPKFRKLWRLLQDEAAMNAAGMLYEAVQLTSWQHGDRLTAEDAAPHWMSDITAPTAALIAVGLLDENTRLPAHAWNAWFAPAVERRANLRERWKRSNRRRSKADTTLLPRGYDAGTATPVRPSVRQTDNQSGPYRAGARGATGLAPVGEIDVPIEGPFKPFKVKA